MSNKLSVYEYREFHTYLLALCKHHRLTARKLASKLEYRSDRSVGMLLSQRRPPSRTFLEKLSLHFSFNENEMRYLEVLGMKARHPAEAWEKRLTAIRPEPSLDSKELTLKSTPLGHWYHAAICQLMKTDEFVGDPGWIAQRLLNRVSVEEVQRSLTKMLHLGLIQKASAPRGYELVKKGSISSEELKSELNILYQTEQLRCAAGALRRGTSDQLDFRSLTFTMDARRVDEAKCFLRDFISTFASRFSAEKGTEVFQCNIQLFSHTLKRGK